MQKHFLSLLAASIAVWSFTSTTRACDPTTDGSETTMVTVAFDAAAEGSTPGHMVVGVAGENADGTVRVIGLGPDGQQGVARAFRVRAMETAEDLKNFGWLGVQIGSVPKTLSDQLQLDGNGTVVLNVVDDSPADVAGIVQNDVVVAINDTRIEGGVEKFIEAVRAYKPGEAIRVTVLRNGDELSFDNVVLGTRPEEPAMSWKFDFAPGTEVEEHVTTLGRMLMKDDEGNWVMHDLGDLDNLPEGIAGMLPKAEHRAMFMIDSADGGHKTLRMKVQRDGETIEVSREDDGEFVVKRTDKDGKTTEATYASEDELKAADEEAAELLSSHQAPMRFELRMGGADGAAVAGLNVEELKSRLGNMQVDIDVHMAEAHKAIEEAMKQAGSPAWVTPQAGSRFLFQPQTSDPNGAAAIVIGRPKHNFEVQEDGRIVVRIRKGDSELVQNFTNESDLEQRDPVLFEKFNALMTADRE
jgi:hypothetical protein